MAIIPTTALKILITMRNSQYFFGTSATPKRRPIYCTCEAIRCRTDFADIQNKKECGGNRQWQNHYLRNWAANTKGKGII